MPRRQTKIAFCIALRESVEISSISQLKYASGQEMPAALHKSLSFTALPSRFEIFFQLPDRRSVNLFSLAYGKIVGLW
jgi:hypothetical protein